MRGEQERQHKVSFQTSSSRQSSESLGSALAAFVAGMLLYIPNVFIVGFTTKVLWNWFIPPIWASAPHLTVIKAAGLSLVLGLLTYQLSATHDEDKTTWEVLFEGFFKTIAICAAFLLCGVILHYVLT